MNRQSKMTISFEQLEVRVPLAGDLAGVFGPSAERINLNDTPVTMHFGASAELNGKLYYVLAEEYGDVELWVTDGTAQGTEQIFEIPTNAPAARQNGNWAWQGNFAMTTFNNEVYFSFPAYDEVISSWTLEWRTLWPGEIHLWKSDGSSSGTSFVQSLGGWHGGGLGDATASLHPAGDHLLIEVHEPWDDTGHSSLWVSDGTSVGTTQYSPRFSAHWQKALQTPVKFNGAWYFLGFQRDPITRIATAGGLWKTTPGGDTELVKQLPFDLGKGPRQLTEFRDRLYFWAHDDLEVPADVWESDGTSEGTIAVQDAGDEIKNELARMPASDISSQIAEPFQYVGTLADQDIVQHGGSLFTLTTNDQAVTKFYHHETRLTRGSNIANLTATESALFFTSGTGSRYDHTEVQQTDGSASGTAIVPAFERLSPLVIKSLDSVGDSLFAYTTKGVHRFSASSTNDTLTWRINPTTRVEASHVSEGKLYFVDSKSVWKVDTPTRAAEAIASTRRFKFDSTELHVTTDHVFAIAAEHG